MVWARATAGIASPEHSHDVLHGHDEEKVVALEVNRNRVRGVEENLVVFRDRQVGVPLDLEAHLDDAAADPPSKRPWHEPSFAGSADLPRVGPSDG